MAREPRSPFFRYFPVLSFLPFFPLSLSWSLLIAYTEKIIKKVAQSLLYDPIPYLHIAYIHS